MLQNVNSMTVGCLRRVSSVTLLTCNLYVQPSGPILLPSIQVNKTDPLHLLNGLFRIHCISFFAYLLKKFVTVWVNIY